MRLHTNATVADVYAAMNAAKVGGTVTEHKSRKATRGIEVKLTGASKRRPNGGNRGAGDDYAADWDQWGVFLSFLYEIDPNMSSWAYKDSGDFDYRTNFRFANTLQYSGFPADYHGDHKFEFAGTPFENSCTKCSATRRHVGLAVDSL